MASTVSKTRVPTSDISVQWTPNSGANNYSRVTTNDGDTSYVYNAAPYLDGAIDIYGFTAFDVPPCSVIVQVTVHIIAARITYGGFVFETGRLRVNGADYEGTQVALGGAHQYTEVGCSFATNPAGGAWLVADVNGTGPHPLQGFGASGAMPNKDTTYMTQCYIEVTYLPALRVRIIY